MRKMDRNKRVIRILTVLVVILALVVLYALLIRPAVLNNQINVYTRGHTQGQVDLLNNMVTQLQQTGYVQLNIGNQTIILAPVQPTTQPQVQPIG